MRTSLLLAVFLALAVAHFFEENCHADIEKGHKVLVATANNIIREAFHSRRNKLGELFQMMKTMKKLDPSRSALREEWEQFDDGDVPCPTPQPTIFPPPPTFIPKTTPGPTTVPPTQAHNPTTTQSNVKTTSSDHKQTTSGPTDEDDLEEPEHEDKIPTRIEDIPYSFFAAEPEDDIYHKFARRMQHYLQPENGACDGAAFENLNSVTEEQLYGVFSSLATNHPGPFCNLCDRMMTEIRAKILTPNPLLLQPDEIFLRNVINAYIPDPHLICSALAPGCYSKFHDRSAKKNLTEAVVCLECTLCQSGTNVLIHKVLLNKPFLAEIEKWLHDNFFANLCAELCTIQDPLDESFNIKFTIPGCLNFMDRTFKEIVVAMINILKPERFCVLELGWCGLHENGNIIHCLRELCEEALGPAPAFNWLCSQIPDRPDQADAFLNIQKTKVNKELKKYHYEYLEQFKDEL